MTVFRITSHPVWSLPVFIVVLAVLCAGSLRADEVLTSCTEAQIQEALEEGGTITFACDGAIALKQTLVISNQVILDALSRRVTLTGSTNDIRLIHVLPGGNLTLRGLTLEGGTFIGPDGAAGTASSYPGKNATNAQGGALFNDGGLVMLVDCLVRDNLAQGGTGGAGFTAVGCEEPGSGGRGGGGLGGAIYHRGGGLTLLHCTFRDNAAVGGSGGLGGSGGSCGFRGDGARGRLGGSGLGGAVYVESGEVLIENCSFFLNSATGGGGGDGGTGTGVNGHGGEGGDGGSALGGAVYVASGAVSLNASTIAYETCVPGARGLGGAGGSSSLDGDNGSTGSWNGECLYRGSGEVLVANSILDGLQRLRNCGGILEDNGYNLSSDSSCGFDDTGLNAIPPMVTDQSAITNVTIVLELLVGSPAIDRGGPEAPVFDQLYHSRPDEEPDMGAVEFGGESIDVSVTTSLEEVSEGTIDAVLVEFCHNRPLDRSWKVGFSLGGTAILNTDYLLVPIGTSTTNLIIPAGSACASIMVRAARDQAAETNETIVVTANAISSASFYPANVTNSASLTILDANLGLRSPSWNDTEGFTFLIATVPGKTYLIDYSSDLRLWSRLTNVTASGNPTEFTDPSVLAEPRRFYRVVEQ